MSRNTARDGTVTTFEYDAQGRLIERCEGDVDGDGDPTTCNDIDPITGANRTVWTRYFYDANWPSRVSLERRRSRINSQYAETEYVYDSTTGRLRYLRQRGFTRSLTDTVVGLVTQETEYLYDTEGRLSEVLGPADERTVYTYWPTGSGAATGMLRWEDRYVDATTYLRTSYSNYTALGHPTIVTEPSGSSVEYGYDYGGMRLRTIKIAGLQTSMDYDAAGRLWRITEPTGRSIQYTYDGLGRIQYEDVFDAGFTGYAERTAYGYDDAGRRTSISAQRINGSGGVVATTFTWSATYDAHGYRATETRGPQGPVQFTYDSAAMGYLESLTRGDGDVETYVNDDFGRHAQITRTFATGFSGTHQLRHVNATGSNRDVGDEFPTTVTDPGGAAREYVYDDFGHLVRSSSAEWGVMRWHWTDDRLVEMKRPDGTRTAYTYDGLGRVLYINHNADSPSLLGQDYQFAYDNDDGAITCPTAYSCAYREGRLARVSIEFVPGSFWEMYYDYVADGQVGSERWPDGRETVYTYANGQVMRMQLPARATDSVRYEYDATAGDQHDGTEVRRIVGERGTDIVTWADNIERDSLGRVVKVTPHDNPPSRPSEVSWRTDGRVACWWVYRRNTPTTSTGVADRCYAFSADGSATGHDSVVVADSPRTFFYDGGNRLTCATSTYPASSCAGSIVESYVYDEADNRETMQNAAGTTSYAPWGNTLYDEYPPGREIWYEYEAGPGGPRSMDREVTTGSPSNQRTYTYDGEGRLSVLSLFRPTAAPSGVTEHHTISILYDHRSRPLMVIDKNDVTGAEARWQYYYDLQDRLINYVSIPNASAPTTYQVYSYVHIEPMLVGTNRAEYVSGALSTEQFAYYAMAPEGLPAAAYQFDRVSLATTEVWRGQWGPFATMLSETGDAAKWRPPFRFQGQLALPNSDASWWNGGSLYTSRQGLALNRYRVYDPRVGQYLQPEPVLEEGAPLPHAFAYAGLAPVDRTDPTGRDWDDIIDWWCLSGGFGTPFCLGRAARRIVNECASGSASWTPPPAPDPDPQPNRCECTNCGGLRGGSRSHGCTYRCSSWGGGPPHGWICNCPVVCPQLAGNVATLISIRGCECEAHLVDY